MKRSERGTVAIELALLIPVIFALLFGIIEFGRAYNAKNTLTHAARETVRPLALGLGTANATLANSLTPIPVGSVTATLSAPCTPGSNGTATVNLSYPMSYSIPFFGSGTWTLTGVAQMRCGG